MPEPQTLLTVVAPTLTGRPAAMAAWRATFCPRPAPTTLPRITSSTWSTANFARRSDSFDRHAPQGGRGDFGQGAQIAADRRARAACEPNFVDHESRAFLIELNLPHCQFRHAIHFPPHGLHAIEDFLGQIRPRFQDVGVRLADDLGVGPHRVQGILPEWPSSSPPSEFMQCVSQAISMRLTVCWAFSSM